MIIFLLDDLATTRSSLGAAARCGILLGVALDTPVEDIVVLVTLADKEVTEELAKVGIIRFVVEAESASVVQEDAKFVGEAAAKEVGGSGHFLFHDAIILLLLRGSLQTLPGKSATQKVHEDVSEGLEVVSAGLFNTQMSVDGSVTSSTSQVLVLSVGDVEVGLWVAEFLRETKVNDVDLIAALSNTHQEIVWFDVTMDEVAGVNVLDARNLRGIKLSFDDDNNNKQR